jgi:hypothetical protein
MTRQDIFNQVYLGLKAQGFERSVWGDGAFCQYRGPDGLKCALGQLLPDEHYQPWFDDREKSTSVAFDAVVAVLPKCADTEFYNDLQLAHDCGRTPERMQLNLSEFADEFGLEIPNG